MESALKLIVGVIALLLCLSVAIFFIFKAREGGEGGGKTIDIMQACALLLKNGCDESLVNIEGKSFEEICELNGFPSLEACKHHCGC